VRFTEWFRFAPIADHQKAVLAEDFMEYLAPEHWPPEARAGFCWLPENSPQTDCRMKEGVLILRSFHHWMFAYSINTVLMILVVFVAV